MNTTIDLRRLHVLRLVHQHGTVTAAAEALHLTPSAVSHQLRQLAREVGVDLLEPDGRRVRLTGAGLRLVAHADELLAGWERVRADLAALAEGEVGTLRMCAFPTGVAGLLAPAAAQLAVTAPNLEVRIAEIDDTSEAFGLLLAGETDIALISPTIRGLPPDSDRFDPQLLLTEPLDLLVSSDHPLSGLASAPLSAVAHDPWVLAAPGSWDCYEFVTSACAAAGFAPRVVHEATSLLAVAALVSHGLAVAAVPQLMPLPTDHNLSRVPLEGDPPPQRTILTCVRQGSGGRPAIAKGLAALSQAARWLPMALDEAQRPQPLIAGERAGRG